MTRHATQFFGAVIVLTFGAAAVIVNGQAPGAKPAQTAKPATTASATMLTAAISATDDVPGGTETILLVDDNLEVRTVVSALLRQLSYTVLEAANGAEALGVCGAHPGPIDLLLTDVSMPEVDGEEVARRLLTARPNLKVLYMSGYSDSAVASHGVLHQGAAVVLHKPFTGPQLLKTVRTALNERSI